MNRDDYKKGFMSVCAVVALAGTIPCYADDPPAPGPALEARQKLYERIQQARASGMNFSAAYKALEDQVKAGDSADKITARVGSIDKAVNDQMARAKILKSQKPLPPQGSQITGGDPIDHSGPAGAGKGGGAPPPPSGGGGGIGGRLKDKLDSLPESVKEKILEKIQERTGGGGGGMPPPGPPQGGAPGGNPGGGPPKEQ